MTVLFALYLLAPPLKTVPSVDLQRYSGRWYEIARYPNWFQKACAGETTATYKLLNGGQIEVVNRCREKDGKWREATGLARLATRDGSNAKLEVRFAPAALSWLPAVWGDYQIIALGGNYEYAVVGTPDRKYLWFLARQSKVPPAVLDTMKKAAVSQGFEAARIIPTRQDLP